MKQIILLLALFCLSCEKQEPHPYTFYYWKTQLALDETEKKALNAATTAKLYTRFFDIDKINGKIQPVATLTKHKNFHTEKEIVPVVFMMNRTFLHITPEEITFLAQNVSDLIKRKTSEFKFKTSNEIQIDCDWTAGTRDDFFKFLLELKKISGKEITSTLRLHQVKDKKLMGIPPVTKVYLMCYSTSSPLENSGKNSILDVQVLKSYLSKLEDYPIKKIDLALPIYSWGIVTNHLGKRKLINALTSADLQRSGLKKISENEAEVLQDGFYFGNYLNKGFTIKIEEITADQLEEVISFLEQKIQNYNIIYYQLDAKFVKSKYFENQYFSS